MSYKYFIPLMILFVSCTSGNKSAKKLEQLKNTRDSIALAREKKINTIISDYSCVIGWDTSNLFTYELKEILDSSSNILLSGDIVDIIKSDSFYYQ